MCLDYSRIEYITLSKALDFYNTFVSIESVNLDEAIDFTITIDENINPENIEISPMLLQPFIENAIIHGLAPRNKNMKLHLEIYKEDKYLRCVLTDNGIGREKAAELNSIKKKSHQSVGIELTKKGIVLQLQKDVKKGTHFEIIDNYDENNNPIGTTVNLKIAYRESKKQN
jgi:sensor histidine kinase YesM